ncbi:MAG: hypothetical protein KGJ72_07610 [Gammaproteobacteria bacterium]|nr:hypothetical protein [Gammaproteobacteria bacterium]
MCGPIPVPFFDDRLEIENPGLLPFGLTVQDMRDGVSRLHNRVIARVFRELGYIEQWGSGIRRMSAACREAGRRRLPGPPEAVPPGASSSHRVCRQARSAASWASPILRRSIVAIP